MASLIDDLSDPPGDSDLHYWADWAELLCITASAGMLSDSDLAEEIERQRSTGSGNQASQNDKFQRHAREVFNYLAGRALRYDDTYPFELSANGRILTKRSLTDPRIVYLFLLVCSSFKYVPRSAMVSLAGRFEWLCLAAAKLSLPSEAEVHLFGKNPLGVPSRYVGSLVNKLNQLADDLCEVAVFKPAKFKAGNTGDWGLDIVAWLPSGDRAVGRMILFGQCACTAEWVTKQQTVGDNRWNKIISITVPPVAVCYIPFDFRDPSGDWYNEHQIFRSYIVDRWRLMYALGFFPPAGRPTISAADLAAILPVQDLKDLVDVGSS
ncbi:hypothetical protein GCM10010435_65830 [Winogradskya consettensis]|uniref:Uncharacterized protein n=1 Tax=Winogradskya consettensis TaxID=113560 RepID=A0A919T215_9ACTN|nr:hypothetical protein [Actinoplanes consettensis]GIM84808.1 hypothetical protein Aco04nite_93260 [Actinoplanes consettensis]